MEKCLLSIDWDYFICGDLGRYSFIENKKSLTSYWYKRYFLAQARGEDIQGSFKLGIQPQAFWEGVKKKFVFDAGTALYVSDSHALSHKIARENGCEAVYLFDSHSDLGYGGVSSLDFELNCSNWLGKLLKEGYVKRAFIFYSPFAAERPQYFSEICSLYDVKFCSLKDFQEKSPKVAAVHICRSGAWTPPWLDEQFFMFVYGIGIKRKFINCARRKWDPYHVNLSNKIRYLME